jgi:hypothetical protein
MQQTQSATILVKGDLGLRHVCRRSCRNRGHCGVDLGVMFGRQEDFSLWISNAVTGASVA